MHRTNLAFPWDMVELSREGRAILNPIDVFYLYQASALPNQIQQTLKRIGVDLFQWLAPIPYRAYFQVRYSHDILQLYSLWREEKAQNPADPRLAERRLLITTGFSDSRIVGQDTLSQMVLRLFVRDLSEGLEKGLNTVQIVEKSVLRDWLVSDWVDLKGEGTPDELTNWDILQRTDRRSNRPKRARTDEKVIEEPDWLRDRAPREGES